MFYFFPFASWALLRTIIILSVSSPFIFSLWFSRFTAIFVLLIFKEICIKRGLLLYFIEESLSVLLLLVWLIVGGSFILLFLLSIKGAMVPFHKWFIEVIETVRRTTFIWGITLHKVPLILLSSLFSVYWNWVFLGIRFILGTLVIFILGDTRRTLVVSSRNTLVLLLLLLIFEWAYAFLIFIMYIGLFWRRYNLRKIGLERRIIILGVAGIPPFLFLQLKLLVFWNFFNRREVYCLLLTILSGVSSLAYIRLIITFSFWDLRLREISFFIFWYRVSILIPTW